jgi:ATP adenylyltransferase
VKDTGMLYTPWREEFILGPREEECIFCEPEKRRHVRELILHRGQRAYVVLNRYPYNSGHLMVVPYRHLSQLEQLKKAERNEIMDLVALSSKVINERLKPAGMNLGMNLEQAGGAGIPGHLHVHLVPRWVGDTNFMPAIFKTRVLSVSLATVCKHLRAGFKAATRAKAKR